MTRCSHSYRQAGRWTTVENTWSGEKESKYLEGETVYTHVDIDLHRFKCTQCDEVMYYSGRAREHFEEGTVFPYIKGLDKDEV